MTDLSNPHARSFVEAILRYIMCGTDKISLAKLQQVVSEVFTEGAELMPTIAEQLMEQGRAEGLVKGREAAVGMLRRFLAHRFGVEPERFDQELANLDLAAITRLSELAFEAKDLAEFEAGLELETGQAGSGQKS